jgi:hypothetical protein
MTYGLISTRQIQGDALRRFVIAILLGLFVVVGVGAATEPVQAQTAVFNFKNSSRWIIYVRMYSQSRDAVWPADAFFVLNDRETRASTLACVGNETICYGAGYQEDGSGEYYGVGVNGNYSCSACCIRCGQSHTFNLGN